MQNQAPDPVPGRRLTEMSTMEREKLITRNILYEQKTSPTLN